MGYSDVDLANRALDHIGKAHIASLTENSTAARRINDAFEPTLHEALSESDWSFSRQRDYLAEVTNDWSERWAYKYDVPGASVRFIRLVPTADVKDGQRVQIPFDLSGGAIYTNEYQAKGEYIAGSTNTLTMPVPFLTAVSFLLARNIAIPMTRKQSEWARLDAMWEKYRGKAISHDAGQSPQSWIDETGGAYIDARGSGGGDIPAPSADGSIYWTS